MEDLETMDRKLSRHSVPALKYLLREELSKFFRAIDNYQDFVMFNLIYRYELRASEVGLLLVDDLNLANNLISITRVTKSQSEVYDLPAEIKDILKMHLRQRKEISIYLFPSRKCKPTSRNMVLALYRKYYDKAGLTNRRKRYPHCLRRSIAVHSVCATAGITTVRELLEHEGPNSTLRHKIISGNQLIAELHRLKRSPLIVNPPYFGSHTPDTFLTTKNAIEGKRKLPKGQNS